jgi:hypothetical protein
MYVRCRSTVYGPNLDFEDFSLRVFIIESINRPDVGSRQYSQNGQQGALFVYFRIQKLIGLKQVPALRPTVVQGPFFPVQIQVEDLDFRKSGGGGGFYNFASKQNDFADMFAGAALKVFKRAMKGYAGVTLPGNPRCTAEDKQGQKNKKNPAGAYGYHVCPLIPVSDRIGCG